MQSNKPYDAFSRNRENLSSALAKSYTVFSELGAKSAATMVKNLAERVASERLRVLILGEFKTGKSTLINAILGQEILPAFAIPCTAVINKIAYGDQKRAVVHFRPEFTGPASEWMPDAAKRHIEASGGKGVPPLVVKIDELERYVVIPDPAKDHRESVSESPFSLVEIFWPLALCKDGVEIIDSPGLNEHQTRTEVTVKYLANIDATVFVLSSLKLCAASEMMFIEAELRSQGHKEIFFACTFFDQIAQSEKDRVRDFVRGRLGNFTTLGEKGIFFVSSRDALEARAANDSAKYDKSGFAVFESGLASFLVHGRGRLKLLPPARQLQTEITKALTEEVPLQHSLLMAPAVEFEKRLVEATPKVEWARSRSAQVIEKVQRGRERLRMDVKDKIEGVIRQIADKLPAVTAAYVPKQQIKMFTLTSSKAQATALVQEVAEYTDAFIKIELGKWQEEQLSPYVRGRLEELSEEVREAIDSILADIDAIKSGLQGKTTPEAQAPGGLERVLSAGAGLVLGGLGSMVVGSQLGFKEMLKSLLPVIGVTLVALLAGITNPFVLIGLLLAPAALQNMMGTAKISERLKKDCIDHIVLKLRETASSSAQDAATELFEKSAKLQQQIEAGLKHELDSAIQSVDNIIAEKRQGEAAIARKLEALNANVTQLKALEPVMQGVVAQLS